jgi:single stranded DNA-binding protein
MPKSANQVILVGNVGKDPEVRYSQSGTPVANFSLAPNERFKDRNDEWQERTEWHNIVAWQRLAEIVGEYVAKGSKLYVEEKIQTSSWETGRAGRGNIALKSDPQPAAARPAGKQRRQPPTSEAQRESGLALLRWLRRNCGRGYSILKCLGDSCTSLRRESCHESNQRTRQ